jgi:peptidoglycan/xylan/chitin deacetylase (PgdA/CDA1 family)
MPELQVVMYHYVRHLARTRYPAIKGMTVDAFRAQVQWLSEEFEMCSLEAALEFLGGTYRPRKDLCLLTFDDGLKEHFTEVMPILAERRIQGLFGVITGCVETGSVAPVHKNHFLTAVLSFEEYRTRMARELDELSPGLTDQLKVDADVAQRSYPLDTREMASFKFMVNFLIHADVRDAAIRNLFVEVCGAESAFSSELYMNWQEIRALQSAGMLIAGHTHWHRPLSTLSPEELEFDVKTNRELLDAHASAQTRWPFSYPYGKRNSYSPEVIGRLKEARFDCAFNTENGHNVANTSLFEICRTDCKNAIEELQGRMAGA